MPFAVRHLSHCGQGKCPLCLWFNVLTLYLHVLTFISTGILPHTHTHTHTHTRTPSKDSQDYRAKKVQPGQKAKWQWSSDSQLARPKEDYPTNCPTNVTTPQREMEVQI